MGTLNTSTLYYVADAPQLETDDAPDPNLYWLMESLDDAIAKKEPYESVYSVEVIVVDGTAKRVIK